MKGLEMQLTDLIIKQFNQAGRYTDNQTKGLHLWVKPTKKRYWIFRYTLNGRRQNMSLGTYPEISLKQARQKAIKARDEVNSGKNPITDKKASKGQKEKILFQDFALEYISTMRPRWSNPKHADQWSATIKTYAFPIIGKLGLDEIETKHIKEILLPIWSNKNQTAKRLRGRLEKILSSATVNGYSKGINPAIWNGHLEHILPQIPKSDNHHAAVPYEQVTSFMNEIKEVEGITALALQFTILNASRTSEVIKAKRSEINGDIWTIPASRMKNKKEHLVPLCKRSIEIIRMAHYFDPNSDFLFSKNGKTLSSMAMLMLTRRHTGGKTVHGFRSTFRDWIAEETEHSHEVAEMALAHTINNKVEAAYRRGILLERRRKLMNDWECFCLTGKRGKDLTYS